MRTRNRHHRPKHRVIAPWPGDAPDPDTVADLCRYVGSAEHKSYPSPAGPPALRSDATRCEPSLSFDELTGALREAVRRGCTSASFEGGFPKYVWGVVDGAVYEARHINGPQGTYKGYRLDPEELPDDPEGRLVLP